MTLMELAVDNGKDQKNKNSDDSNGDYPIRSHPGKSQSPSPKKESQSSPRKGGKQGDQYLRAMPLNVLILVST